MVFNLWPSEVMSSGPWGSLWIQKCGGLHGPVHKIWPTCWSYAGSGPQLAPYHLHNHRLDTTVLDRPQVSALQTSQLPKFTLAAVPLPFCSKSMHRCNSASGSALQGSAIHGMDRWHSTTSYHWSLCHIRTSWARSGHRSLIRGLYCSFILSPRTASFKSKVQGTCRKIRALQIHKGLFLPPNSISTPLMPWNKSVAL